MQDWGAHLEFLRSILTKFDANWALAKATMIRIFQEDFWPSVRVEMNQCNRKLDSFKEIIERVVNVEATAKLKPSSNICEMDQNCS